MMRIFVTGSGGILGRHVMRHLGGLAPEACIVANCADLTDAAATRAAVIKAGPLDLVIHLAALVPVAEVQADPARAYAVNVGGTLNLLAALEEGHAALVYCSSGHVYAPSEAPLGEEAAKRPLTLYGRTKWAAECAAADICGATGRSFCAARVFSIHDPDQTGSYLRPVIERRIALEDLERPFVVPGGDSLRDFLTADVAAKLLVRLALAGAAGPVNVGSGRATRIRDFVQSLSPRPLDLRATGPSDTLIADISRLTQLLGDTDA